MMPSVIGVRLTINLAKVWAVLDLTDGRGVDAGIDAVGMEASGSAVDTVLQTTKLQPDRLSALLTCLGAIRRGGTLSITGVYTAWVPFFPLGAVMDRQLTMRVG